MRNDYQEELSRLRFTAEGRDGLLAAVRDRAAEGRPRRRGRKCIYAVAAAVLMLLGSTAALAYGAPVMAEYYQNSAGYRQSAVALGQSITQDGWTMTLTDSVMDQCSIYAGIELTAPQGTVLDQELYYFEDWQWEVPGAELAGASHYTYVTDADPTDNAIEFILWITYSAEDAAALEGGTLQIRFGSLYHNGAWNAEDCRYERIYDCQAAWELSTAVSLPETVISLEPNVTVHTLDVDATLTHLTVTPLGVYATIEGDALKGHHAWVEQNAPDGWYGCVEYQEITLYLSDGTAIPLTEGLEGSGCSGETDLSEPGALYLSRRADTLLDMDLADHITVCGVEIPLR